MVARSDAVGLATEESLAEWVASGEIKLLSFTDMDTREEDLLLRYGIVSRAGDSLTPAARAMIDTILRVDQQLLTSHP
ncbi:hypothetical protein D3C80_2154090 [compost metagenome]